MTRSDFKNLAIGDVITVQGTPVMVSAAYFQGGVFKIDVRHPGSGYQKEGIIFEDVRP